MTEDKKEPEKVDPNKVLIETETYTQQIPILNAAAADELKALLDQNEGDLVVKDKKSDKWLYVRRRTFLKTEKKKDANPEQEVVGGGQVDSPGGTPSGGGIVGADGLPVSSAPGSEPAGSGGSEATPAGQGGESEASTPVGQHGGEAQEVPGPAPTPKADGRSADAPTPEAPGPTGSGTDHKPPADNGGGTDSDGGDGGQGKKG